MAIAATLPHDPPLELAKDLYVVHGCVRPGPMVRFTRNMLIVREGKSLTLINPVRMDDAGLEALEALGEVDHILRLGPMHGMDDVFYMQRYQPQFWSFADGTTYTEPAVDRTLTDGGELPFGDGQLFAFKHMSQTEGAILLRRSQNILVTCDAIQSYATPPHTPHTNWFSRLMMPLIGFPKKTLIGPVWVKLLVTDREGIKSEFERLLEWEFDQLIAAHGTFLASGAHAEVRQAFDKMFGGT